MLSESQSVKLLNCILVAYPVSKGLYIYNLTSATLYIKKNTGWYLVHVYIVAVCDFILGVIPLCFLLCCFSWVINSALIIVFKGERLKTPTMASISMFVVRDDVIFPYSNAEHYGRVWANHTCRCRWTWSHVVLAYLLTVADVCNLEGACRKFVIHFLYRGPL